jgi:hypothetical protein
MLEHGSSVKVIMSYLRNFAAVDETQKERFPITNVEYMRLAKLKLHVIQREVYPSIKRVAYLRNMLVLLILLSIVIDYSCTHPVTVHIWGIFLL